VYLLSLACALPRLHAAKRPKTLRLKFDEVDAISDESWVAINGIYNAGDDRLFILDQTGVIKIYDTKSKTMASTVPFLDITAMTGESANDPFLTLITAVPFFQIGYIFSS